MSCAASEPHSGVGSREEEESEKTDEEEEEEEDMAMGDWGFFGCRWPEQSRMMKWQTAQSG